MSSDRRKRLLQAAFEFLMIYSLTGLMVPEVGRGPWALMVVSYVLIQAINTLAFHRAVLTSNKIIHAYMERWGHEMDQRDLAELFAARDRATFDRFSIYSPYAGVRIWWINRRVLRAFNEKGVR